VSDLSPAEGPGRNADIELLRSAVVRREPARVRAEGYRLSAVLLPFIEKEGEWHLLLTRRADDLEHHRGQVAFPGGSVEAGESAVDAALRETGEEIGIHPEAVEVIGEIDEIWTPTGYVITPVVGVLKTLDGLAPDEREVARVFTVPLAYFADEGNAELKTMHVGPWTRDVYFYYPEGETVWGATAFIIRGMLKRMERQAG